MKANSMLRRAAIATGVLAGVVVAAVAAIYLLVDVNQFRPQIQEKLQAALGRRVELGSLGLGLFPPAVDVADVQIGESAAFRTNRPFAQVGSLAVRASLFALLRGRLEVSSLVLRRPQIELVRNAAGQWNWADIGSGAKPSPDGNTGGNSAAGLSLADLRIEDASIALSTLGRPASRTVYGPINLEVQDLSSTSEFRYNLSLHLPGSGDPRIELSGKAGPLASGDSTLTPFDADLSASDVRWSALLKGLQMEDSGAFESDVKLAAKLRSAGGQLAARGALTLSGVELAGRSWNQPVDITFDVQNDLRAGLVHLTSLAVKTGSVPITITGQVRTSPAPATADLHVSLANADLHALLPLLAVAGASLAPGMDLAGQLTADVRLSGPTGHLAYNGALNARDLRITAKGLAQPVRIPSLRMALTPDAVRLDPFHVEAGNTRMDASLALKAYSTDSPQIEFQLKGDSLDIDELEKLTASSPGANATEKEKKSAGSSSSDSLRRWKGNGSVALGRLSSQQLVLEQVRTDVTLSGGVLRLAPLSATVFNGSHQGSLEVDLRQDPPVVTLDSKLQEADVNRLLTATSSMKDRVFGLLASNIAGSFQAGDSSQIMRTLNGSVNLDIANGRVAGFNLLNQLSSVGRFSSFAKQAQDFTQFTALKGQLDIKDGVGTTNNLEMVFPAGSLAAAGSINLVAQTLDMKVTAVLNQAFSGQVGGTKIGGYLTSALANQNGELVIPALVTGSLDNPKFAPDVAAVAKMKVQRMLPSAGNPGALIEGVAGAISGKKSVGQSLLGALAGGGASKQEAASQAPTKAGSPAATPETAKSAEQGKAAEKQPTPAESVQGILDIFKKKEPPPKK